MSGVLRINAVPHEQPDTDPRRAYWFWCPGCNDAHRVVDGPNGWTWDGNETAPTFSPSILVTFDVTDRPDLSRRCHSFLRGGVWEFLGDCTHAMAGQRVPMVPLPEWLSDDRE